MPRYRIHSPWLEGHESNGVVLLPPAIEKLRESAVGKKAFVEDVISDDKCHILRTLVGKIEQSGNDLVLVSENGLIFAPPGKSNRIEDYASSFCIRTQHDPHASDNNYDVLENGMPYGRFLSVEHVTLVDKDKCGGYLELI